MVDEDGLDNVLSAIGLGWWQIPPMCLFCLITWVIPGHMIGSTLLSAPVNYKCFQEEEFIVENNQSYLNSPRNSTMWPDELFGYDSRCLDNSNLNQETIRNITQGRVTGLLTCPEVEYDNSTFISTVITEWHLICEKEILRPLYQMLFSIGAILGTLVSGPFSDCFGRKRAIQAASIVCLIATICMYFMPWYIGLLVLRVIIGASCNCMMLPAYNLVLETIPPQSRSWIGVAIGITFSIGVLGFAGLGYLFRDWHDLLLASSLVLILLVPLAFWVNESPRWLLQNSGEEEVAQMLAKAAKRNKGHLNDVMVGSIERLKEKSVEESLKKEAIQTEVSEAWRTTFMYFRSLPMRIIIIVTPLVWLLQNCLYLGIMLNANNFTSSNPFAYIAMSGAMDGLAILLATPFTVKLGRRLSLFICFICGGIFLILDLAVPPELWWMSWILVMTSLLLIAAAVQINFLYASEMFPTSIRARGFAWAHFAGNIGFAVAPLVTELLSKLAWWSVSVIFGCAGLVAGGLIPLLPETNNRPLPETILDVEERYLDNKLEKKRRKAAAMKRKELEEAIAKDEEIALT